MSKPLTAGERLAPDTRGRGAQPDQTPPPKRPKRRGLVRRVIGGLLGAVFGLLTLAVVVGGMGGWMAYQHFATGLPDVEGLRNYQPPVMSRVYAGDGRLLADLATERRIFVPIEAVPNLIRQAFLSAEDQNFWTHRGVDPLAIARASFYNFMNAGQGKRPVGASTITQQVAKNMLLDNELSLARKAREAILAIRIEENLSKDRILELYLNEIYLGLSAYGVAAAGQAYFNKALEELTLPEAAFLAALPKAPNNYNPFRFPDAAKARRDWVLDRMAEDRAITPAQAQTAKAEPIAPHEFRRPPPIPAGDWFAEEVRRQLIAQFGPEVATQGGLMVRTSLDPHLQRSAEKSLRDGLQAYDRRLGGWRGAVGRIDAATPLEREWHAALGSFVRPPGMPSEWRLAVVLSLSDTEARIGWLDAGGARREAPILLSDHAWARPLRDGKPGPAPRQMAEIAQSGDIVMIDPRGVIPTVVAPTQTPRPRGQPAPAAAEPTPRPALRQIPVVQGALVSIEPTTGRVLAMVGGWSFEQSQFNRATQAQRQPGSSFKPIVYLTALAQGYAPSQRFLDAPIVIDTPAGRWRPGNYDATFNGPVSMRHALEKSLNLVTLRIAQQVGMQAVADTAIAFRMVDQMPRVLPAALGAVETTVLREAGAYAALAAGGRDIQPTLIDSVQDRNGHVVWRAPSLTCPGCDNAASPPAIEDTRKRIADPASVFQLVTMMQGAVHRGTGTRAAQGLGRTIAGKTGTTQDFADVWFTGFTPDLVTAVWVGFDTPAPLGNNETGGSVAAPIFRDFMAVALKDRPVLNFPRPEGVTMTGWDSDNGQVTDAFKANQSPGASGGIIGVGPVLTDAPVAGGSPGPTGGAGGGVDNTLGGLY